MLVVRVMLWGIGNGVVDIMSSLPHYTIMVKLTANRNSQVLSLQCQLNPNISLARAELFVGV